MAYRHRQSSLVGLVILDAVFLVVIVILIVAGAPGVAVASVIASFAAAALIVYGLSNLTAEVADGTVTATFTWGWPRREIPLSDVVAVRQVRNHWYTGWGIRKIRSGWMYNVWGLDAVELERSSGKVFRIGTDQPAALAAAIVAESGGRLAA